MNNVTELKTKDNTELSNIKYLRVELNVPADQLGDVLKQTEGYVVGYYNVETQVTTGPQR